MTMQEVIDRIIEVCEQDHSEGRAWKETVISHCIDHYTKLKLQAIRLEVETWVSRVFAAKLEELGP